MEQCRSKIMKAGYFSRNYAFVQMCDINFVV